MGPRGAGDRGKFSRGGKTPEGRLAFGPSGSTEPVGSLQVERLTEVSGRGLNRPLRVMTYIELARAYFLRT